MREIDAMNVKQPWAGLIAFGLKTMEIRSWRPSPNCEPVLRNGRTHLIVASKRIDDYGARLHGRLISGSEPLAELCAWRGCALCVARIGWPTPMRPKDATLALCDYCPELYAWPLSGVLTLPPRLRFEVRGQLGIYKITPPPAVEAWLAERGWKL